MPRQAVGSARDRARTVGRRLCKAAAALFCLVLSGCAFSGTIDARAVDYNRVEEDANNQLLVINILRARDNAPLYLAEFQNIHVSLTGTVSTGNVQVPFGPGRKPATKLYSASPSVVVSSQPTFDATQLDTQQFTLGMLRPIEPVTWEYYWHRDYSPYLLLHLFLASIQDGDTSYTNSPCVPGAPKAACDRYLAFRGRVEKLAENGVYLNPFTTLLLTGETAKGSVSIGGRSYAFETSPPQVAICTANLGLSAAEEAETFRRLARYQVDPCPDEATPSPGAKPRAPAAPALLAGGGQGLNASGTSLSPEDMALFACTHRQVVQCHRSWANLQQSSLEGQSYVLRSVDGIIRYLGRVQRMAEADPAPDSDKKGVVWTEDGVKQTLFQLHLAPGPDRVAASYRGHRYFVREGDPSDHTLEVLSLLNQLINANKNANEIPSTKAVQIVP